MRIIKFFLISVLFFSCVQNPGKKESFYNGHISVRLPDNWKVIEDNSFRFASEDFLFTKFVGDSLTGSGILIEVRDCKLVGTNLEQIANSQMRIQEQINITTKITKTGTRRIDGKSFFYYQYEEEFNQRKYDEVVLMCLDGKGKFFKFTIRVAEIPLKSFEEISDNIASSIVIRS